MVLDRLRQLLEEKGSGYAGFTLIVAVHILNEVGSCSWVAPVEQEAAPHRLLSAPRRIRGGDRTGHLGPGHVEEPPCWYEYKG